MEKQNLRNKSNAPRLCIFMDFNIEKCGFYFKYHRKAKVGIVWIGYISFNFGLGIGRDCMVNIYDLGLEHLKNKETNKNT